MAESQVAPAAILLDIEGTVTPIRYVYEKLFPYARAHGSDFIHEHWNEPMMQPIRAELEKLNEKDRLDGAPQLTDESSASQYYLWLMDRDRKVPPLKTIQGLVWERGFHEGTLTSEVFADVQAALERWRRASKKIAIYSSGSVLAQQNVFRHSDRGNLSPFISAYFDTAVGSKRDASSYREIAKRLDENPDHILFLSDSLEELDAASTAQLGTGLCIRPGNAAITRDHTHKVIHSFDEIS